jgi:hypothetical protein
MHTSVSAKLTALGLTAVVAVAALFCGVSGAAAATKPAAASESVETSAGGPIDVQIWPGQQGKTAIITVVNVDAKTKLPVTVRIPVVPGSTVEWAGEILGGPAASDLEQPHKLIQGQGGEFAELTLTKSHRGQVDTIGFPLTVTSDTISVALDWVQSVSSPQTSMVVRIPANVSKVKISPKPEGDPQEDLDGEMVYTLSPAVYKPGEKQKVTISYSTVPPVEPKPGSELNLVLIGLGAALVIAAVVLVVLFRRQGRSSQPDEESTDADSESESGPVPDDGSANEDGPADEDELDLDFD